MILRWIYFRHTVVVLVKFLLIYFAPQYKHVINGIKHSSAMCCTIEAYIIRLHAVYRTTAHLIDLSCSVNDTISHQTQTVYTRSVG